MACTDARMKLTTEVIPGLTVLIGRSTIPVTFWLLADIDDLSYWSREEASSAGAWQKSGGRSWPAQTPA